VEWVLPLGRCWLVAAAMTAHSADLPLLAVVSVAGILTTTRLEKAGTEGLGVALAVTLLPRMWVVREQHRKEMTAVRLGVPLPAVVEALVRSVGIHPVALAETVATVPHLRLAALL